MKPKISVIVPAYNVEKYIEESLNSIINQTLKDIEIIIINDGSTDKSTEIINEISRNDSRVIVINQKNSGVSKARNIGMMLAKGDYISFIDSDDYIETDMLEKMYRAAEKYDCDIVQCNYAIDNNGERREVVQNIKPNKLLKENEIIEYIKTGLIDGSLATYVWNKIFKRQFLRDNDLMFKEDLNMFEDWYFIMDIITYTKKMIFLPENLYNYRIAPNSLSRKYIYNHEDLILNLQSAKLNYIKLWNLNINPYKSKYIISLYDDLFKIIHYILNDSYNLDKNTQFLKINSILKSELIENNINKNNDSLYILNRSTNKLYLKPILYGVRNKNLNLIYYWVQMYKFIKKG